MKIKEVNALRLKIFFCIVYEIARISSNIVIRNITTGK